MDPIFRSGRTALNERVAALMRSSRIACDRLEVRGGAAFDNLRATLERAEEVDIEGAAHGFLLVLAEELYRDLQAAERFLEADSAAPTEEDDPLALVGSLDALGKPPAPINAALRAARRDDAQRRLDAEFARLERLAGETESVRVLEERGEEDEGALGALLPTLGFTPNTAKVESFEETQHGWQGAFRADETLFRITYRARFRAAVKISIDVPASAPKLSLRRRTYLEIETPRARYTGDERFDLALLITTRSSRKRISELFSAQQRRRLLKLYLLSSFTLGIDEEAADLAWRARLFSKAPLLDRGDMRKALDFLYTLSADLWRDQA